MHSKYYILPKNFVAKNPFLADVAKISRIFFFVKKYFFARTGANIKIEYRVKEKSLDFTIL